LTLVLGTLGGWLIRARYRSRLGRTPPPAANQHASTTDSMAARPRPVADETAPCVRNTFALALGHSLAESARRGDPLSVLLARIDMVQGAGNRRRQADNQMLEAVGKHLITSVRAMDWVARFDATTFAFLLPNTAHVNSLIVAERLRKNISTAAIPGAKPSRPLTLSIGATDCIVGDTSESILRRVEEAMFAAVQAGGDRIEIRLAGDQGSEVLEDCFAIR